MAILFTWIQIEGHDSVHFWNNSYYGQFYGDRQLYMVIDSSADGARQFQIYWHPVIIFKKL